MTELERISDQLQRAYAGPAWHGPCVKEALEGVTPEIAARRPIGSAHTIWELVHHIGAWADIPRRRILGEAFEITDPLNFPPMPKPTAEAWQRSLDGLAKSQKKLVDLIAELPVSRLDEPVMKDGPTVYVLLHGVVQHAAAVGDCFHIDVVAPAQLARPLLQTRKRVQKFPVRFFGAVHDAQTGLVLQGKQCCALKALFGRC